MSGVRAGLRLLERPAQVEAALWRRFRYEQEEGCRTSLFERYTSLARSIARHELRRRPPHGLDRSDFEQLAFSGLLEAIDRFDPMRGAPFEAYARHRIKGAIADGAARSSEGAAQFNARKRAERDRLTSLMPGEQSENPIAALADLASALAIGLIADHARVSSAANGAALEPYETLAWRETELRVLAEIEKLGDRERIVMQQHYLNDVPFTEIAKLLRLSKGRIAQIHRAAIERVRVRVRQGG